MPLIRCPDCQYKVSSQAPTCPQCGAPICKRASNNSDQWPAETRLKIHAFLAWLTLISGVALFFASIFLQEAQPHAQTDTIMLWAGVMLSILGFFWALLTRFRSWWYDR